MRVLGFKHADYEQQTSVIHEHNRSRKRECKQGYLDLFFLPELGHLTSTSQQLLDIDRQI